MAQGKKPRKCCGGGERQSGVDPDDGKNDSRKSSESGRRRPEVLNR